MVSNRSNFSQYSALSAEELAAKLDRMYFADAVDIVNHLSFDQALAAFEHLPLDCAIGLFNKTELLRATALLTSLESEKAADILDGMAVVRAKDIFQDMNEKNRRRLFVLLEPATRTDLQKLMNYPRRSAGALMTTEFITVLADWTVEATLNLIRTVETGRETVYTAYIIDPETNVLLSAISLRLLVLSKPKAKVIDAAKHAQPIQCSPTMHQRDLARLFRRYDLLSIAVVDEANHIIGIVTVDNVLDSMTKTMSEETQKFGGMEALEKPYMQITFLNMLEKRGGWLCLLFVGEMLTASVMQHYEHELAHAIVLTLFIPLIMSSGGNSGSQATSLIIRALALNEIRLGDWWRVVLREIPMGLSLGAILGAIGYARVLVWQFTGIYNYGDHWFLIALTVGGTLIAIVMFGSLVGSMLPFVLKAMGFDPASASAPFVATFVDVAGIAIYFSIAAFILAGTLL
ncbi:MAG: Magnesium transporter [Candidatus Tokpelaia hoelldobleri]|uniref:Magnesium transporter MgtE n=1 Tax=Candidatus Tokpelaia hoelldobleri TaxID=1902579 RepID=A0A1U9JVB9_9HYPH|nr:MAG: Magnesium transporter [Candidatus Tokpelaia hoelldoblerii]